MTRNNPSPSDLPYSVAELNSFPDDALLALVEGVDRRSGAAAGVGVTLSLPGVTVSGVLVAADEFYQAAGATNAPDGVVADSIRRPDPAADDDVPDVYSATVYIHLTSAVLYTPAGEHRVPAGTIWRGRLTQVSAWFLGRLDTPRS